MKGRQTIDTVYIRLRQAATVGATLLAATAAVAQAPSVSMFGFTLGSPVHLPDCPVALIGTNGRKFYEPLVPQTCVQDAAPLTGYGVPVRRIVFTGPETPLVVKNWTLFALEIDGKLAGLHFITAGIDTQSLVLSQLVDKFGQPTSSTYTKVQNRAGAVYDTVVAEWHTPNHHVVFSGTLSRLDVGEVTIDLPAAHALRKSWRHQDRQFERKM